MALELLNNAERLASADIFSFGLTMYELCFTHRMLDADDIALPLDGPMWHVLRSGNAECVHSRPPSLTHMIANAMAAFPEQRPSAGDLLSLSEMHENNLHADPTLLAAKCVGVDAPLAATLNRTASCGAFVPLSDVTGSACGQLEIDMSCIDEVTGYCLQTPH